MFGGKRWCFTTCALFMLCPRSSYVAASRPNAPVLKLMSVHGKDVSPRWTFNLLSDKGTSSRLEEAEPGFDFTEEEMKTLKIWPGGAIPYYIDEFSFDKVFRDRIRTFLDVTNSATGLNFLELHRPPGDDETRWVFFVNRQGLLSCVDHPLKNFTSEGVQKILLGYDCLSNGAELAEIILALAGVPPQHNAPDRDRYIEILNHNIMPGKSHLFEKLQDTEWLFHEVDYDFASASHYNLHKYTVNGKATIKPLKAVLNVPVGDAKGFSYTDIWKLRMLYNYISKKRLKSLSKPECDKLFIRGANFDKYVPETEDDVIPRRKPNKYLALSEDPKKSSNNEEIHNEAEDQLPNVDNDEDEEIKKEDENAEVGSVNEQNAENEEDKPDEPLEKIANESNNESNGTPPNIAEVLEEVVTDKNLSTESDYIGDDGEKGHELKFVKPVKNS